VDRSLFIQNFESISDHSSEADRLELYIAMTLGCSNVCIALFSSIQMHISQRRVTFRSAITSSLANNSCAMHMCSP